jgi:hypothetical protein
MMAYPTEGQKGMFISIFWTIFNLGGIVGSAVAFGTSFESTVSDTRVTFVNGKPCSCPPPLDQQW